jgi:hypothetical protein
MRPTLYLALLAQPLVAGLVLGGELVKPTLNFSDMRIVVTYVSTGELATLQDGHGFGLDRREIRQNYRHGFSILKKNTETGALTCEIYLPHDQRPREVDDEATLSLGHELLHCMRGDYHR